MMLNELLEQLKDAGCADLACVLADAVDDQSMPPIVQMACAELEDAEREALKNPRTQHIAAQIGTILLAIKERYRC